MATASMKRTPGWLLRIIIVMLACQTGVFLVRPVLSYRALELGAGAAEVGFLLVAYAFLPALVSLPIGRYCDTGHPLRVVRAGAILLVFGCAGLAISYEFPLLTGFTIVLGLGSLFIVVGAQSLVARASRDHKLDANFGLLSAAASLGQMAGPALAGVTLTVIATRTDSTMVAFILGAIICLIAIAVCGRVTVAARRTAVEPTGAEPPKSKQGVLQILRIPTVMGGIFTSMALLGTVDLLVAYLPLLGEMHGIEPAIIGMLLSLRAGASVTSRVLIPLLLRHWSRRTLVISSTLATSLSITSLPFLTEPWMLGISLVLAGFFLGLGQPLTIALLVQAVSPDVKGAALSVRILANKMGQVGLSAIMTVAANAAGTPIVFVILGVVLGISSLGVLPTARARAHKPTPPEAAEDPLFGYED